VLRKNYFNSACLANVSVRCNSLRRLRLKRKTKERAGILKGVLGAPLDFLSGFLAAPALESDALFNKTPLVSELIRDVEQPKTGFLRAQKRIELICLWYIFCTL